MKPAGSTLAESASMPASACPELYPGAGEPLISTDRNMLKCVITWGAVSSRIFTTLESGSISPAPLRT